jgi:hypothetical protein
MFKTRKGACLNFAFDGVFLLLEVWRRVRESEKLRSSSTLCNKYTVTNEAGRRNVVRGRGMQLTT